MKGNTMTKKTVVVLVGLVVLAFVTVAVCAATNTGVTLTKDTSITNVEACSQYCGRDYNKDCDDCDGNCANCDKRSKCQGYKFGKCGGHGNGI